MNEVPAWFWILSLSGSLYQGYRGYTFQRIFAKEQNRQAGQPNSVAHRWSESEIIVLRAAADAIFYFVCAGSEFVAIFLLHYISSRMPSVHQIDGGTSALLIFLAVFGLLGVTGKLPHLIQEGKIPR